MQSETPPYGHRQRDVLVGTLRSAAQLEACLAHRFYHIPEKLLPCPAEDIRYVALYQSRRLFAAAAGVRLFGGVDGFTVVQRREIAEIPALRGGNESYCRFAVTGWQELERPVLAVGLAPLVSTLTTRHLLENSRHLPELYIRTAGQLRAYTLLRGACARTRRSGGSELLPAREGFTVMVAGTAIGIYSREGRYEQRDLREFLRKPDTFLRDMQAVLEQPEA